MVRTLTLVISWSLLLWAGSRQSLQAASPPNIVYIMSDELAYFELSHMGNPYIKTPRIDRMAAEGLRFTQAMAVAPVCAPLRCGLMTGKHMGHASVRANDGGTPLRSDEKTIASLLKPLGYATGGFGKWGAGGRGSTGVPEKHGFDVFYGYYDQVHAHSFYPPYLIRNSREVALPGNRGGRSGETYSHYEIMKEALQFIRENRDRPFFCYLPITPPHGMYDIPESDPAWEHYRDKDWPGEAANYAAMVTMVDRNVGEVLDLLKELELEANTIVFFTGDNGGQDRFRTKDHPRGFLYPNKNPLTGVEFRGGKGNLYQGGLRIPFLVRWPGRIESGRVSDFLFYQPDILPTLTELTGAKTPADIDGLSILPELLGEEVVGRKQKQHNYFYWEFGSQTAVRSGKWKAIQPGKNRTWELYDLEKDVSETRNLAAENPSILERLQDYARKAHEPVRPGTYEDRTDHEKDRWAKWGDTRGEQPRSGKVERLKRIGLIDRNVIKVAKVSSENADNGKYGRLVLDGKPGTHWHSRFQPGLAQHPHEIVLDLGSPCLVKGIHYLSRQDGSWNGLFGRCEIFISEDERFPEEPVTRTTLKKTRKPQVVSFKPIEGRYVMIRVLSEINGGPWASAAEIGVEGVLVPGKTE